METCQRRAPLQLRECRFVSHEPWVVKKDNEKERVGIKSIGQPRIRSDLSWSLILTLQYPDGTLSSVSHPSEW